VIISLLIGGAKKTLRMLKSEGENSQNLSLNNLKILRPKVTQNLTNLRK